MTQKLAWSWMQSSRWLLVGMSALALPACKDLAGSSTVPSGTLDPKTSDTPGAVLQRFQGIQTEFGIALNLSIMGSGTLSDELSDGSALDKRQLPQRTDRNDNSDPALAYVRLQDVRAQAGLTAREISAHTIDVPSAVRGELYALQGYAEVLLADLYCSGIPLTTLDVAGTVQNQPGTRSDSVYAHAARLFDSASALSAANPQVMTLARVGKGRALLALGQYDAAAQTVASVATTDEYSQNIVLGVPARLDGVVLPNDFDTYSVSDREGGNGLPYRSSNDPRTTTVLFTDSSGHNFYYAPGKYQNASRGDSIKMVVASGIEARLIEAEAQLHAGQTGPWLTTLNTLRADGGVSGLLPLTDPGTERSRVDTLFAERAKWLFLTAHRQGDLRRLLRQYPGRSESQVYPAGRTSDGDTYGDDVTAPIPASERFNPYFDGCFDRLP